MFFADNMCDGQHTNTGRFRLLSRKPDMFCVFCDNDEVCSAYSDADTNLALHRSQHGNSQQHLKYWLAQ